MNGEIRKLVNETMTGNEFLRRIAGHQAWLDAGAPETGAACSDMLEIFDTEIEVGIVADALLVGARLIRCVMKMVEFNNCDFTDAMFIDCDLRGATFNNCIFRKAELMGSDARGAKFTDSSMTRADFTKADLRSANLSGCDLAWAWLTDADLRQATLEGVNLDGTRIVGTHFFDTRHFATGPLDRTLVERITLDREAIGPTHSGIAALSALFKRA